VSTSEDARAVGQRKDRRTITLDEAWREFRRWPSPRFLAVMVTITLGVNLWHGDWRVSDAWLPLIMIVTWPLVEWTVHTLLLHMKPKHLGSRVLDPLFARKHREHHADPTDTELVFLPMRVLWTLLPVFVAVGVFAFPRLGLGLTFLLTIGVIAFVYEWNHYLIHSEYRPRTAAYRAIWRHHRLHHYKNENYWFGLTSTYADHLLRTAPDLSEVERSPTARTLEAGLR